MLAPYLRLPNAVKLLALGILINRAGTMVIPFLTMYLSQRLELDDSVATLPVGAYGLGAILAALAGGHLADTVGRRPVMLFALFGGAAVLLMLFTLTSIWAIVPCVFIFALVAEMYRPAGSAMIADLVPPAERPYAYTLTYIAINLGFAIGPAVAGLLVKWSYGLLFVIDAGTTSAYGLLIVLFIRETLPRRRPVPHSAAAASGDAPNAALDTAQPEPAGAQHSAPSDDERVPLVRALCTMAQDRAFMVFSLATLAMAFVYHQAMSTFPLFLARLGIPAWEYGPLIALNGMLIVIFQVPLSTWLTRYHRGRVVALGAAVTAVGFGLNGVLHTVPMFGAAIAVWTLGEMMQTVFMLAIVADLAPPALRARYMGVISICHGLGMAVGAPLGGAVLERFGGGALWSGCAAFGAAAALLYFVVSREARVRSAAHEASR